MLCVRPKIPQTDLLQEKAILLQEQLTTCSEQIERFKAGEAHLRRDATRISETAETLRSQLDLERQASAENSQKWEKERSVGEHQTGRLSMLLDEEKARSEEEAERLTSLLEKERVLREEEGVKWAGIVEGERQARRAESALGDAVLREVRETQNFLEEVLFVQYIYTHHVM